MPIVRMLCVRSASLTKMTRRSFAIASSILRKLSACASSRLLNFSWSILLTPSTSSATSSPNALCDLGLRDRRVFDDVVQDRRVDRVGVEMQVGEDLGDGDRMGDVGIAGAALLALVRGGAELGGLTDALDLVGRKVDLRLGQQLLQPGSAPRAGTWKEAEQRRRIVHGEARGWAVSLRDRTAERGSSRAGRRCRSSARESAPARARPASRG